MSESNSKLSQAERLVKHHLLASLAVGAVPVPLLDAAALAGVQLNMLRLLAECYGAEFSEELGRSVISSLVGGGIPVSLSTQLASLAKLVPLWGTALGMAGTALFGAASTYAIGKVFIQHFESGRTLLGFDPARVRAYYEEQFRAGQDEIRKNFAGVKP